MKTGKRHTPAREKILKFRTYTKSWDFGEGISFSIGTIKNALLLDRVIRANGIMETDAFPGGEGDIMVTAYHDEWYWEFLIAPSNTVNYRSEKNDEEIEECQNITFEKALYFARRLKRQTWKSLESFIPNAMIDESKDSTAWLSNPLDATSLEYPSSTSNVSRREGIQYASISFTITRPLQASHQSSGDSILTSYPQAY